MKKGFTLMEVIIAIAIILTALVTLTTLISSSVAGIRPGKSKIIATNLAQEGLELVRSIRDNNWLAFKRGDDWDDGLGAGDYRAQYDSNSLLSFASVPLKIDSNGFYQYDTGSNTVFYRKITITQTESSWIGVVSEVTWQEKGRSYNISARTNLYNWLEQ